MSTTSTERGSAAGRPEVLLALAVCSVVLGAALVPVGGWVASAVGYVFAAPLALTLVVFFRRRADRLRTVKGEVVPSWTLKAGTAVIATGIVVAVLQAWNAAAHFA